MNYELIKVENKDHITTVTINRPEVMNCISPQVSREMSHAFDMFDQDPGSRVCILTGAGDKAFSSGNDLKYQVRHGRESFDKQVSDVKGGFAGITYRYDCFKPFIAAVNGLALGGGFEIALACDIIIASTNASFGLPEPRVGLMAAAGGVHRLPRQIPYHLAMGMIMTSKRLSPQEALQYGLVNEVVSPEELLPTAEKWAAEIMKAAPLSILASKEASLTGMHLNLEDAMRHEYPGVTAMYNSKDAVEGPKAFAEKLLPQWKSC